MAPSLEEDKEDPFDKISDEIVKKIFYFLPERDMVRVSGVSTRFFRISDEAGNCEYWKRICQRLFEYRTPFRPSGQGSFEFPDLGEWQKEENPWKKSFKQLYHGVHVRRGYKELYSGARTGWNLNCFESLEEAIRFLKWRKWPLIFLHPGHYFVGGGITIDTNLQIIGAAPGKNIADKVIIEGEKDTAIRIIEGANQAYLGYVTVTSWRNGYVRCAVEVSDDCSPVIDHCTMHSCSDVLRVRGRACPKVRHCTLSDSRSGIVIEDQAEGVYENCKITQTRSCGVFVASAAAPVFKNCLIHHGSNNGVDATKGKGLFEGCNIHHNRNSGIVVSRNADPIVLRCDIHHNRLGVRVCQFGARGTFLENKIHQNNTTGISIDCGGNPTVRNNEISHQDFGLDILDEGKGLIEGNSIHGNALAGIKIQNKADPTVQRNKIHHAQIGIHVKDKGKGLVEDNDIYYNAQAGVLIQTESNPTLRRNRIFDGMAAGVEITIGATATLVQNVINSKTLEGLVLAPDVRPTLKENDVLNNGS